MKMDEISALLEKYQRGVCTEEEKKAIDEWYANLRLGDDTPLSNADLEQSLAKIRGNIPDITTPAHSLAQGATGAADRVLHGRRYIRIDVRRLRAGMVAAAILLLAGSCWWIFLSRPGGSPKLALLYTTDSVITTGKGETRQIVLPDGTTIQLNAATSFSYPKHFSDRRRPVTLLKGEAYFQVVSDPARPFTVTAGTLQTTVLGTSFDIRSYDQEQTIQIALLTGRVNITEKRKNLPVSLLPHQLLRFDKHTGKLETGVFENDYEVAAWKQGGLNFKDASFGDIAFEIGNKYNIGLVNNSDKRRWSYTGFFREESLQEVIETICQTEHLSYIFRDNEILINNK